MRTGYLLADQKGLRISSNMILSSSLQVPPEKWTAFNYFRGFAISVINMLKVLEISFSFVTGKDTP